MLKGLFAEKPWLLAIMIVLIMAIVAVIIWGLLRLNKFVFGKVQQRHEGIHLRFFQRVTSAMILVIGIIVVLSAFDGVDSLWKTLLGGTAIISGVIAFAAQDVIKDILGGLMISVHKPFEVGNRIELEDSTFGIVKDMTMRHVVLQGIDTQFYIVPNSKINVMKIRNFSYHATTRAAHFDFFIGYNSDIERTMEIIKDAVIASPLSIPGKQTDEGEKYADVYFMKYEQSSLKMSTTVYYEAETPSEVLISDINSRVNTALKENGIEIPYPYINLIQK